MSRIMDKNAERKKAAEKKPKYQWKQNKKKENSFENGLTTAKNKV